MPLTLTSEEVASLTNRDRPSAQQRVLRELGIPYKVHPTDGILLVARAAALSILGVEDQAGAASDPAPLVNIEAMRRAKR